MQNPEPSLAMGPTTLRERIESIDILRAIALFGVVAMHAMSWSGQEVFRIYHAEAFMPRDSAFDAMAYYAVAIVIVRKSYTLFALLFGFGLAMQMEKAEARGTNRWAFVGRRCGALLLIGAIDYVFISFGDVLMEYACIGFLLPLMARLKPRTCIIVASALIVGSFSYPLWASWFHMDPAATGLQVVVPPADQLPALMHHWLDDPWSSYSQRAWLRFKGIPANALWLIKYEGANAAALFLVGMAAWKSRLPLRIQEWAPGLRTFVTIGLPVGLAIAWIDANPGHWIPDRWIDVGHGGWWTLLTGVGRLILAASYAVLVFLLLDRHAWHDRLKVLGPMGRMALTNYLMQFEALNLIFNRRPGFGLFAWVSMKAALVSWIAICVFQVWFSRWWLARFEFGPAEWLWRCATYWKWQPFRKVTAPSIPNSMSAQEA